MDFVRQGGRLGLVCDLHDSTGLPVPFFGKPARSVVIPAMIARRVGARIWMARCLRVGHRSEFEIEFKELKVPRSTLQTITLDNGGHAAQFEAWVLQHLSSGCGYAGGADRMALLRAEYRL